MSRIGLGHQLTELCDGPNQIALASSVPHRGTSDTAREANRSPMASARSRPSSAAARARDRVTSDDRPERLPAQDLAQPSTVAEAFGPARSPRRSTAAPPRGCRPRPHRRRSARGPTAPDRRVRARSPRLVRPDPCCRWRPLSASSTALSASARARTAGATWKSVRASSSVRAASNQASPSWMRPRVSHSGCSDDASRNASSISAFSRLHANAARRLSISVSACSMRCSWSVRAVGVEHGRHRRVVVAVTRSGQRRPRRTRRAFPARTGAPSPAAGIALRPAGVFGHHQRLVDRAG